jgi:methionine salvage enolase-phosphatase E1
VQLPRPKAIILELTGSLVTRDFMPYSEARQDFVRRHINQFFAECYPKQKDLRLDVNFFKNQELVERKLNAFNELCPTLVDVTRRIALPSVAIEHILFRLHKQDFVAPLTLFMLHMHEWAYRKGIYQTPVYKEARQSLEEWNRQNISVYVDAASEQFVQTVLSSTTNGNLTAFVHRNISLVDKGQRNFDRISSLTNVAPKDVLVITRNVADLKAAQQAGCQTLLLLRDDFEPDWRNLEEKAFGSKAATSRLSSTGSAEGEEGVETNLPSVSGSSLSVISADSAEERRRSSKEKAKPQQKATTKTTSDPAVPVEMSDNIVQPNLNNIDSTMKSTSHVSTANPPLMGSSSDLMLRRYNTGTMSMVSSNSNLRARTNAADHRYQTLWGSTESLQECGASSIIGLTDPDAESGSAAVKCDGKGSPIRLSYRDLRQFPYINSLDQIKFH